MGRRCLIVDDNAEFLDAAFGLLQGQGMSVVGMASTSSEALALAADLRPEVALVDVDLGEEDGFELAEALADSGAPVPVILISAYSEKDLRELLETSSAVGFLSKSVLSAAAIEDVLGSASASRGT